MQRSRFLVRDILSAKFARYVSGLVFLVGFSFLVMSFTNDDKKAAGNNGSGKDSSVTKAFPSLLNSTDPANTQLIAITLNPKIVPFVEEYLGKQSRAFESMKDWGKTYFDLFDRVLSANNLPVELKYLSVVESHLRPQSISGAGAAGPWQIMPAQARSSGLRVDKKVDERTSFQKSTKAAAKMLKGLYNEFGDWLLVIAAYNAGSGRVRQAIAKAGSADFYKMEKYLPAETRNHVKRYIAAHYFFEGQGSYTTMTAAETAKYNLALAEFKNSALTDEEMANTALLDVSGKYNGAVISRLLTMDIKKFKRLNPGFDRTLAEGKVYHLRLPREKVATFKDKKQVILQESVQLLLATPVIDDETAKN